MKEFNFEKGDRYTSDLTEENIYIIGTHGNVITFIEGWSPSAIHSKQEMSYEYFVDYITKYKYEVNGKY